MPERRVAYVPPAPPLQAVVVCGVCGTQPESPDHWNDERHVLNVAPGWQRLNAYIVRIALN